MLAPAKDGCSQLCISRALVHLLETVLNKQKKKKKPKPAGELNAELCHCTAEIIVIGIHRNDYMSWRCSKLRLALNFDWTSFFPDGDAINSWFFVVDWKSVAMNWVQEVMIRKLSFFLITRVLFHCLLLNCNKGTRIRA